MRLRIADHERKGNILSVGDELKVIEPTLFSYLVHYRAPVTGGGTALLAPGVRLIVKSLPGVRLQLDGRFLMLMGTTASFKFADPELVALYIDPVVGIRESARERMRTLYSGYTLYLNAQTSEEVEKAVFGL